MPAMALGQAGKAPRAGPRPCCPPLLPQLVTASLSEPSRCSTPSLCHHPKRETCPLGSRVVCPGAAEHIHRCRPPLPVHTLSPCSLICLFMLGFTRVTLIVKRKKKKKDACILKCKEVSNPPSWES
ncbi:unnamed protein product [Rangifer tarandus platyrhynchus]|uniref:Uncharacterized protein n=1 Tax=Rangifer tarandus platyrhynchus TaxID=3082113 RepID=A0AC59Z034_RANTA